MGKAAPLASASAEPSCGPWVPALATLGRDTRTVRMADTLPNGRAEARARPGHERVAADAMALERDVCRCAPPASFPIHHFKQRSLLLSRGIFAFGFFSFLFSLRRCRPPERGDWRSAQRRPALYVSRSNARRHACEA